ncbi:MAG: hypothetical protein V4658_03950 [Bacteroidota bacterium]
MNNNNLHTDHDAAENRDGFVVPGNYFEQSRNHLLNKINNGGFTVPEQYFEQSRQKITGAVANTKKTPLVISLNTWWYAAAAVVLLASVSLLFIKPRQVPQADLDKVTNEEIVNYFLTSESISDIPANELYTNEIVPVTKEDEELLHQLDEELLLNEL